MRFALYLAFVALAFAQTRRCDLHTVVNVQESVQTPDDPGHSFFFATGRCGLNITTGTPGTCAVFGPHCDVNENPRNPDCRPTIDTGRIVLRGAFLSRPAATCGNFATSGACHVCLDSRGQPFIRVAIPSGVLDEEKEISADPLSDEKPWSLLPEVLKLATHKPSDEAARESELVYPLPEVADIVTVLVHALHCRDVVVKGKSESEMDQMHQMHCGKFHRAHSEMRQLITKPSEETCRILFGLDSTPNTQSEDYLRMVGLGGSYSYGYLGGQGADEKKASEDYLKMVALGGSYDYHYLGGAGADAKGVSEDYLKMMKLGGDYSYHYLGGGGNSDWQEAQTGVVQNARGFIPKIAGYAYGNLLMKQHRGVALTTAEQAYMDSWESPLKLKQGALAYACSEYPGLDIYS